MKHVCAEGTDSHDSCTAYRFQMEQPRSLVACDRIVGLRCINQIKQEAIRWIFGLVFPGDRIEPDFCAVKVVQHVANVMGLKPVAELRSPARGADFIDLMLAG